MERPLSPLFTLRVWRSPLVPSRSFVPRASLVPRASFVPLVYGLPLLTRPPPVHAGFVQGACRGYGEEHDPGPERHEERAKDVVGGQRAAAF